jgi:hypothetical protein
VLAVFIIRNGYGLIALMVAASTSETSVDFNETTRRNNPKDSHSFS